MKQEHVKAGEVIFREGDASDTVGFILAGRVEVLKRVNGHEVVLGEVAAGEFVGEMGVIEGRPRGATVRAKSDVTLRVLTEEEFTARIGQDPDVALQIVLRLSERLRAVNQRLAELQVPAADADDAPEGAPAGALAVRLFAASRKVAEHLPADGLPIERFPFHVGRLSRRRGRSASVHVALRIPDSAPYRLSRQHFSIVRDEDGRYAVRDVGSTLGTIVNGQLIGQHAPKAVAPLEPGDNQVVAGGLDSSVSFRVVVGAV